MLQSDVPKTICRRCTMYLADKCTWGVQAWELMRVRNPGQCYFTEKDRALIARVNATESKESR